MLNQFFVQGAAPHPQLWIQHDPVLVALSVAMAIGASVLALHMASLARAAESRLMRHVAWLSGALALGGGIWAMHFIGMLAFTLCAQGQFDLGITGISMLPGVLASWVAIGLLMRDRVGWLALAGGGVLVGAGIGTMHYVGMAAAELAPVMRYDPWTFLASIAVAVVLAILALWVRFGLRQRMAWKAWVLDLVAGSVMGLAIAGMHYMGMAALRFVGSVSPPATNATGNSTLVLTIAVVVLSISGAVLAINMGLRYRQLYRAIQVSESRMRAVAETAVDGIILIDGQGIVQSYNSAARRMLGWEAQEVIGRNVNMLMPEPHQSAHDNYLQRYLATGDARIIGSGRDVPARRKDGVLVPIRLAVGRVDWSGPPLFVGFLTDISGQRAMEATLRSSEQQLRSLVSNIPGVTFRCRYDADWSMLFVSDAVQELTGWSAADFVAGRVTFTSLTHADDVPRLWQEVSTAFDQDRAYHVEYRLTDRSGATRWISESGRGVTDDTGAVQWIDGVIMDITSSRARNAEFEGTVNAINRALAVIEFDLQGTVLHANQNFLAMTGYTLAEVVGQHHRMFCSNEYLQQPDYAALWERLAQGEIDSGEYLRKGKDQRDIWIQATYNPIFGADGRPFKVVKFATDLTERRAMEQELRAAKDRAEQAAAARGTFLANMSHEIRTPMNAIIGFTEALLDSPLDTTQRRHLGTVHHASRSMLRLLNDILDTAKLEKGAVELEVADFSLYALCEQVLASLRIQAARKSLAFTLQASEAVPEHLRGDALRLQQVLLNLLGNSLKFTERGGVTLRLDYGDGVLAIEVEDTGIGIAEAQLQRIFDPFAQADATTTRQFGGTGLGTTIARQLVELMGGSIAVRSVLGQGSVFTVSVPLPVGVATAAPKPVHPRQMPPLRVLAADDVPANLELLQIHLDRGQHRMVSARDGEEAVNLFMAERFDVVLMDLQMPGLDGFEATRRIRAYEQAQRRKPVPVIALSASVLEQDRRNARAAGMNGFASKPLEPVRLFAEIARVMGIGAPTEPREEPAAQAPPSSWGELSRNLAPAPASALDGPIDWERGVRLWTQMSLLRAALLRFLSDNEGAPEALRALQARSDFDGLAALAHRMRGAASNLGLRVLQQLTGRIEEAGRSMDRASLDALVAALPAALAAARTAVETAPAQSPAPTPDNPALVQLTPAAWAQADVAIQALGEALTRSELSQDPLDALTALLPAVALERLQDAIDTFDFDNAQRELLALRQRWTPPTAEAPFP